jgi:hypothetical protein
MVKIPPTKIGLTQIGPAQIGPARVSSDKPAAAAKDPTTPPAATPAAASSLSSHNLDEFTTANLSKGPGLFGAAAAASANAARNLAGLGGSESLRPDLTPVDPQAKPTTSNLGMSFPSLADFMANAAENAHGAEHPDAARFPKLPSNREASGNAGASSDALRPSMDPRDWISGSRGTDFLDKDLAGKKTVENLPGGDTRTTYNHGDGTSTIVTDTHSTSPVPLGDGRVVLGMTQRSVEQRVNDGPSLVINYVRDLNRQWIETGRNYVFPGEGINRTLDPNADGGNNVPPPNYQMRDSGPKDPNRYKPSGEANSTAPRLVVHQLGLVGDPDLLQRNADLAEAANLKPYEPPVHVLPPRPGSGGDDP